MKLLFKLISMLAVFVLLLSGSKCAERNGDDEKDIQIEEDMIQNGMKASDMQNNFIENIDNSIDYEYDDDAKNAGEDVMELDEEADLVEQDDDDDIRDANEGPMSKEEVNNPRRPGFNARRRSARRRSYDRRRRQPGPRRRSWGWKK